MVWGIRLIATGCLLLLAGRSLFPIINILLERWYFVQNWFLDVFGYPGKRDGANEMALFRIKFEKYCAGYYWIPEIKNGPQCFRYY